VIFCVRVDIIRRIVYANSRVKRFSFTVYRTRSSSNKLLLPHTRRGYQHGLKMHQKCLVQIPANLLNNQSIMISFQAISLLSETSETGEDWRSALLDFFPCTCQFPVPWHVPSTQMCHRPVLARLCTPSPLLVSLATDLHLSLVPTYAASIRTVKISPGYPYRELSGALYVFIYSHDF
jgi:hypothetical protein